MYTKPHHFVLKQAFLKLKNVAPPPKKCHITPLPPHNGHLSTSSSLSTVPSCKVASTFILIVPLSLPLADKIATFSHFSEVLKKTNGLSNKWISKQMDYQILEKTKTMRFTKLISASRYCKWQIDSTVCANFLKHEV